jgi:hypothetical protein
MPCKPLVIAVLALALAAGDARADDVTDQIGEALAAYQRRDIPAAIAALDAATALLRQSRVDAWKDLLPPPPDGWTGAEAEGTEVTAALLGGGTGASRHYTSGDDSVDVSLLTDTPMVEGMAALIGNPMLTGAAGRTAVIGGRRFAYMRDDNAYVTIVANKVLVRIKGSEKVDDKVLRAFIGAVDYTEIEKVAR